MYFCSSCHTKSTHQNEITKKSGRIVEVVTLSVVVDLVREG